MNYLKITAVKVFVPTEWTGINGIEPLKLKWRDTLPDRMKPKPRPINPKHGSVQKRSLDAYVATSMKQAGLLGLLV
jgi:hypothetical protein